jgi:hypothetical protein
MIAVWTAASTSLASDPIMVKPSTRSSLAPTIQGTAAREAVGLGCFEMRRVVAVMSGNFDYWGLTDKDRPKAVGGVQRGRCGGDYGRCKAEATAAATARTFAEET